MNRSKILVLSSIAFYVWCIVSMFIGSANGGFYCWITLVAIGFVILLVITALLGGPKASLLMLGLMVLTLFLVFARKVLGRSTSN